MRVSLSISATIEQFIALTACDQHPLSASNEANPVRVDLLFTDCKTIQLVFVSNMIEKELKVQETKPPIVNQQFVVHMLQCQSFDAGYIGYP